MSYHTNAILRPLPRLGARSVGGLGALGLGAAPDPGLVDSIVAVARKFPNATDGEVLYLAVAGTPGLSPAQQQSVTLAVVGRIVAKARSDTSLTSAQVLAAVYRPPPVLKELSIADRVAGMTRRAGPAAGAFLKACLTDPIGTRDMNTCYAAAEKQVGTLTGDQLSFYQNCLSQKASDMPVLTQHGACFSQAQTLTSGGAPPPPMAPEAAPAPDDGGLLSNKWVWVGGAVAVAGLAYVLLKKPARTAAAA